MAENPYLDPTRVRGALSSLGLRPSKGMGQNFLISAEPLRATVEAAEVGPEDVVVEIGPGLGVLTWELVRRAGQVVSVELDRRLAERLRHEFGADGRFTLVEGDALNLPPGEILTAAGLTPETPYKLVANLPYAITSPLLRHFLETPHRPQLMAIMVQWEVAQRMAARPPDMSILAHAIQYYAEVQVVAKVPAASFMPAPAVDSAIVLLRMRPAPPVEGVEPDVLFRVIRAGFSQARKKLSNSLPAGLRSQGLQIDRETAQQAMAAAGVDANRRAETLSVEEWGALARVLVKKPE